MASGTLRTGTFAQGPGTLGHAQVSVTSGGVKVCPATASRRKVTIINHSSTAVYLGASGVTTSTGVLLPGTVGAQVSFVVTADIFGVVASTSATVSYYEEYD